jgi:hypothetical protein
MKEKLQKLPISIQSFEKLRTNKYLYVDKTKEILKLIENEEMYFLSRPRRFGKSLLISTLENIFKGNKELFKGLYIYNEWKQWNEKYPIIRLDFGNLAYETADDLKKSLNVFLTKIAKENNIVLEYEKYNAKFGELIEGLKKEYSNNVVVLIDEYDKPILDNISQPDICSQIKDVLSNFYQILKGYDDDLRFVFITGVSKFVGTSIFSGMNSPDDITLDKRFSIICGYTQEELNFYFKNYIPILSEEYDMDNETILTKIKEWYNGYSWDGKNFVYNPRSILSLFNKMEFNNYWFSTATPTFLIKLLKERTDLNMILTEVNAGTEISDSYDPENIPIVPLLFQSGYLTIKNKTNMDLTPQYSLNIPNREVGESFTKYLLNVYTNYPMNDVNGLRIKMQKNFLNKDNNGLNINLREMLANIPFHLYGNNESYYHSIFLVWLLLLGFKIDGEISTNIGRMDAVLLINKEAFIIEIKFDKNKNKIDNLVEEVLNQIIDKRYYEKYLTYNLTLLGIAYADKEVKCKFKDYPNQLII